jgi:hypothetical protein
MGKKQDVDVLALKRCVRALDQCTSTTMVRATLDYLADRYLWHPSSLLPMHLKPKAMREAKQDQTEGA